MDSSFIKFGQRPNTLLDYFQPHGEHLIVDDGVFLAFESGEGEIDVSGYLNLSAFTPSGAGISSLLSLDKPTQYYPENTAGAFALSTTAAAKTLWVTNDLGVFFALEHAGIYCAYLVPSVLRGIQPIHKSLIYSIESMLQTDISNDVRFICSSPSDAAELNKLFIDNASQVFFSLEPITAEMDAEYVQYLIDTAKDVTDKDGPRQEMEFYDAWRLAPLFEPIKDIEKRYAALTDKYAVARHALAIAMHYQKMAPAFKTMADIKQSMAHELLHEKTQQSIIRKIESILNARKNAALLAVRPSSWGDHNHIVVDTLEGIQLSDGVTLINAPTASGKTKNVIKPFAESSKDNGRNFLAIAPLISLIDELSHKLGTDHYSKIDRAGVFSSNAMAVCLPSIKSNDLRHFINRASHIAIDEISQNIRFTASPHCCLKNSDSESTYLELRKLINESTMVVAADASIDDMTLKFFEQARPGERFNIYEMKPKNTGRNCFVYADISDLISKIFTEILSGGRVWIAVESADRAEVLRRVFTPHCKTLMINSKNKDRAEQRAFLSDASSESLKYDLVIASPTISSGVSVEHALPHFTMIAGIASGHRIAPTDFMQMLARVRYVPDYHVCLMPNNITDDRVSVNSFLDAYRRAAALEGGKINENDYTAFKAQTELDSVKYRADFANGFVWLMEHFRFNVQRIAASGDDTHGEMMKSISKEMKEQRVLNLMAAEPINADDAERLEMGAETEADVYRLEAFKIRRALGYPLDHILTPTDIEMSEKTRDMDRLSRYLGKASNYDDSDRNLALRTFDKAQVIAYKMLFDGEQVNEVLYTQDNAQLIIQRAIDNRFLFSALGIIPRKYAKWEENKKTGALKPFDMPKDSIKALNQIIQYLGVSLKSKSVRNGADVRRAYAIKAEDWTQILAYSEQRFAAKNRAAE